MKEDDALWFFKKAETRFPDEGIRRGNECFDDSGTTTGVHQTTNRWQCKTSTPPNFTSLSRITRTHTSTLHTSSPPVLDFSRNSEPAGTDEYQNHAHDCVCVKHFIIQVGKTPPFPRVQRGTLVLLSLLLNVQTLSLPPNLQVLYTHQGDYEGDHLRDPSVICRYLWNQFSFVLYFSVVLTEPLR